MQNQHQKDMATFDVTDPAETSEEPKPQNTMFKVVSPKDKISPQQVHENDLSRASDSPDAHKKAQPLVNNKGLSLLSQLILKKYLITQ